MVTLLFVEFDLVVTWLVAVPVCHLGDLVHTIKVSCHVCTWFLACLLPWMGHLVVRQE